MKKFFLLVALACALLLTIGCATLTPSETGDAVTMQLFDGAGKVLDSVDLPPALYELAEDTGQQWQLAAQIQKPDVCPLEGDTFIFTTFSARYERTQYVMLLYVTSAGHVKVLAISRVFFVDEVQRQAEIFWYGPSSRKCVKVSRDDFTAKFEAFLKGDF